MNINSNLYTPIAIVIAGIVVAGSILIIGHQGGGSANANTANTPSTQPSATSTVSADQVSSKGNPIVGSANAPLTIAYWFDYQCPYCKQNELTVMPQLIKDYVDTGKVRIVYKDFSFLGPDSDTLGHWGRAVWQVAPDEFEAWHSAIYQNQGEENTGWASIAEIQKITATVLTPAQTAQVAQLAVSNATQYQSAMDADKQEGEQDGVQGTPALLIGTQWINGAESYAQVKAVIDQQLAAGGK
ncbi:MAG TPA: thioredoxin domain-containing protein [Candidatus Paceibacterota bacterium]|jgi:protein-disulfide isomerase|nr:thioredoxin domain-containing protein [Candidatus Paceibacterota bacterium]